MTVRRLTLACLLAMIAFALPAQAQLFRTYVSGSGSDANPCTLPQPCRLLPAALAAVASTGEVWMLDSANYNTGTVDVTKAVSILAVPGAVGSLVARDGGPAIRVSSPLGHVTIRNVVIGPQAGAPAGTYGVELSNQGTLSIEESVIANLPSHGVYATGATSLRVQDTMLRNNGQWAIYLDGVAEATVTSTRMIDNYGGVTANGFGLGARSVASVRDCVISGSGGFGVAAYTTFMDAVARVSVSGSTIERSNVALSATTNGGGTAEVSFGRSLIAGNFFGWYQDGPGSAVLSLGNNQWVGNIQNTGAKTLLGPQ